MKIFEKEEKTSQRLNFHSLSISDKHHHLHNVTNPTDYSKTGGMMITQAEGIYLYTDGGKRIIDAGSGLANVNIGYGNKRICDVAYQTMQQLSFSHTAAGRTNPWAAALSEKLAEITPDQYRYFSFTSIGSDAMESAIKMAWCYWRLKNQPTKRQIIGREHSYHGNTIMAVSVSGINAYHDQFGLPLKGVAHQVPAPYWYRSDRQQSEQEFGLEMARSLEKKIQEIGAENIAAFIAEPVVSAVDTIIPPEGYWPEIRRICDKHNILLIMDEIVTGFGKTGTLFGFQNFGVEPDMFVMAKGISSGYFPVSSVAIGSKVDAVVRESDQIFSHTFTNCGHPVGSAIALENIAIIEEQQLVDKVRHDIGPYLTGRLQEFLTYPCVGAVRSIGVLGAIEIDLAKADYSGDITNIAFRAKVQDIALEKGLTIGLGRIVLPMIITRPQIDDIITIIKASFDEALLWLASQKGQVS